MSNVILHKGFKDLECWKKGRALRIKVSTLYKKFPQDEKFELTSQVKSSSSSVANSIAEGYGRFTYSDAKHFFIQARGTVSETPGHLITAYDERYLTEAELKEMERLCETVFKLINGYIHYLDKNKKQSSAPTNQTSKAPNLNSNSNP